MSREIIFTDKAPAPIGPYSQAVLSGDTLYVSGQIGIDQYADAWINETIEKETEQVMKNLGYVLEAANMDFSNIVKCSIFISDMNDFAKINSIYANYFDENPPARECVEVSVSRESISPSLNISFIKRGSRILLSIID